MLGLIPCRSNQVRLWVSGPQVTSWTKLHSLSCHVQREAAPAWSSTLWLLTALRAGENPDSRVDMELLMGFSCSGKQFGPEEEYEGVSA